MDSNSPAGDVISTLAQRHHGIVTTEQLRNRGLTRSQVRSRAGAGWLHRVHQGVYAVGYPPLTFEARLHAGVLACGPKALLSHRSAAELWKLLAPIAGPVHVTVQGRHVRDRTGIITHRSRVIRPRDRRIRTGIAVTSPSLTILEIARSEPNLAEDALNEALLHRLTSPDELRSLVGHHFGDHGLRRLLPLIAAQDGGFSRQAAEKRLRKLIGRAGLPAPRRNIPVHGHELDFYWPDLCLNVEMDGYRWHSTRSRLNRDRKRDAALSARGVRVLRFSYDQLNEPAKLIADLAATVALAAAERDRRVAATTWPT